MFTDKAQTLVDQAKDYAAANRSTELTVQFILAAISSQTTAAHMLADCLGLTWEAFRSGCPSFPKAEEYRGKLALAASVHAIITDAKGLAEVVPDRTHPGLIDIRHLVCALAMSKEVAGVFKVSPVERQKALAWLASWYEKDAGAPELNELTETMRRLRGELLRKVFGQLHAVHGFVEGMFNGEVVAASDTKRKSPRAVFVFAGPPGVGKTFLAELGASFLKRDFKRFDMSAYSGAHQEDGLIGMAKMWRGAHPGALTEFVEKNPNAVLLFDEIEKAHLSIIQLFLQVLDAGILEDKFHEKNVSFRDTILIFTTNAGKKLYDRPNRSGFLAANSAFHRRTVLDALENEMNPQTSQPFFPPAICSRLATGYPILFNHLQVNELVQVVQAELSRVGGLFEKQYEKQFSFQDLISMSIVLREGGRVDARAVRSQAEIFVKSEVFNFCQLFKTDRIEEALAKIEKVSFVMDDPVDNLVEEVRALFKACERPKIVFVAETDLIELYQEHLPQVQWRKASSAEEALSISATEDVDMVLLDLWLGSPAVPGTATVQHFDHAPVAARGLERGVEALRSIRERLPEMPVYLLSLSDSGSESDADGTIDEELFLACMRAGGARGVIQSQFIDGLVKGWERQRDELLRRLLETAERLHREKAAAVLAQQRKVLTFDTAPVVTADHHEASIRLRNLRTTRAVAAVDAGEILDEVERPTTSFADVIGAKTAKEELQFFIDFLKNPRRFAALGMKPPKGVLLHGPPGTGKTMLARAMAGESKVAFIPVSATNFVTMWQGSGPQNVRDLFARARRYAPAIIFIDEIDAVGKVRLGSPGSGHGEEMALNALLTEMDGFISPTKERPVFVLAATNYKAKADDADAPERAVRTLDPALVRRFSRCILVDLPDTAARKEYLNRRLRDAKHGQISESAIELLAEKSTGMSISDLETVLETAGRAALKQNSELTDAILSEALDTAREGEAKEWSPEFLQRTARHEAGHTIMYWLSGWWSPEVSIVARSDHGGGMRRSEEEVKRECVSKAEILARIRTCLGGRAAETLYYGKDGGLTTGASGDLEHATRLAGEMICRHGMDENFGLQSMPDQMKSERVSEAVGKILRAELDETVRLLGANREHLDALTKELLAKNRLYRKDLEVLLPGKMQI
jgi:cell division protease FtsH